MDKTTGKKDQKLSNDSTRWITNKKNGVYCVNYYSVVTQLSILNSNWYICTFRSYALNSHT